MVHSYHTAHTTPSRKSQPQSIQQPYHIDRCVCPPPPPSPPTKHAARPPNGTGMSLLSFVQSGDQARHTPTLSHCIVAATLTALDSKKYHPSIHPHHHQQRYPFAGSLLRAPHASPSHNTTQHNTPHHAKPSQAKPSHTKSQPVDRHIKKVTPCTLLSVKCEHSQGGGWGRN